MTRSPTVSVLMAAYNAAAFVGQAIDSVLAQTFADWELIVVDDGSTDATGEIVQSYAARDARIRYCRNESNLGLGLTRQRTLALARGVYAAVLDSDDVALPEWLSRRVGLLNTHRDVALASGTRIMIDENDRRLGISRDGFPPEVLQWQLLFGNPVNNSSCVYRVAEAQGLGGYRDYPYLEDWDLPARLSGIGRIAQENHTSVMYRVHPASISKATASKRALLEPIAAQIMAETVKRETGLTLARELAWLLFRGRRPFAVTKADCYRALDFVLLTLREYLKRIPSEHRAAVAAAAMHDAANVLRCGGWSLKQGWKALRAVVDRGGMGSLRWGTGGTKGALKLLLPYHTVRAA